MTSEPIVLSSDDEDDVPIITWFTRSRKRNRDLDDADSDVSVIEMVPCLEGHIVEKGLMSFAEIKPPPLDDDCCILLDDPDNSVQVPDFQANEADELVVVGERGHVACRDYPHARHLCVKFPFATTPHAKHCEQCHCFVCDVIAPCTLWGQGMQTNDHCHAFDKDEKWKSMRSQTRSLVKSTLPLPPPVPSGKGQQLGPLSLGTGGVRSPTNYSTWAPSSIITPSPLVVESPTNYSTWEPSSRLTPSPAFVRSPTNYSACPFNQWMANLGPMPGNPWPRVPSTADSLPGNSQPYVPSRVGTMLANGYNIAARGGMRNRMGDPYPGSHALPKTMRRFNQSNVAVHNNNLATSPSLPPEQAVGRHTSHQPPGNPILASDLSRNTQNCAEMRSNTYNSVSRVQQYTGSQMRSPQVVPYPRESPSVILENSGGTMQRVSVQPPPLNNFHRDLTTLQSYLMEGVSSQQSQTESTACGMSTTEMQPSVSASLSLPSQGMWSDPVEGSKNSMERAHRGGTQSADAQQTSRAADAGHQEFPLSGGNDTLEQLLASLDDNLWDLLDPTNPESLNAVH